MTYLPHKPKQSRKDGNIACGVLMSNQNFSGSAKTLQQRPANDDFGAAKATELRGQNRTKWLMLWFKVRDKSRAHKAKTHEALIFALPI